MGVPAAIVLAGLAMGLGIYFGLKMVGNEIRNFGPLDSTVTLETTLPIDVDVNLNQ